MRERWAKVPGWPAYEVSDRGVVRRGGRPLRMWSDHKGYLRVDLRDHGRRRKAMVHSLVAETFLGPRPDGHQACHGDGSRTNNRADNLRWGTPSDNMRDSVLHGTHANARKETCPLGHVLEDGNLTAYGVKAGRRECLACSRARAWRTRRRRKGLPTSPAEFRARADAELSPA